MNIANVLTATAKRNPRKAAIVLENENISYERLDRTTTSLARWFARQGLKPGDRVAIHWPNSIETVELFLASFKAGMIAVPINVRVKTPEVAYILEHSKAAIYFAHPRFVGGGERGEEHLRRVELHTYNSGDCSRRRPAGIACGE
jgi:acyl-CoA synthetase (AMP-forming)/AMP-acid ligase II